MQENISISPDSDQKKSINPHVLRWLFIGIGGFAGGALFFASEPLAYALNPHDETGWGAMITFGILNFPAILAIHKIINPILALFPAWNAIPLMAQQTMGYWLILPMNIFLGASLGLCISFFPSLRKNLSTSILKTKMSDLYKSFLGLHALQGEHSLAQDASTARSSPVIFWSAAVLSSAVLWVLIGSINIVSLNVIGIMFIVFCQTWILLSKKSWGTSCIAVVLPFVLLGLLDASMPTKCIRSCGSTTMNINWIFSIASPVSLWVLVVHIFRMHVPKETFKIGLALGIIGTIVELWVLKVF